MKWFKRSSSYFFLVSVLLHGTVLWFNKPKFLTRLAPQESLNEPIVVSDYVDVYNDDSTTAERIFPDEKMRDRQVVSTEDAGNRKIPKKPHYLANRNQTVESPTRAKREDAFHASKDDLSSPPPTLAEPLDLPKLGKPLSALTLGDLGIASGNGAIAQLETVYDDDLDFDSATNDYLPDVLIGKRTLLSAREYAHWAYMQRIQTRVAGRWANQIRKTVLALSSFKGNVEHGAKKTKLIIELDRDGVIEDVSIVNSSGSRTLDGVAVKAFKDVGSFPNPPHALVRSDGTVRIRWSFVVNVARPTLEVARTGRAPTRR